MRWKAVMAESATCGCHGCYRLVSKSEAHYANNKVWLCAHCYAARPNSRRLRALLAVGAILLVGGSMAFGGRTRQPVYRADHYLIQQSQTPVQIRAPLPIASAMK